MRIHVFMIIPVENTIRGERKFPLGRMYVRQQNDYTIPYRRGFLLAIIEVKIELLYLQMLPGSVWDMTAIDNINELIE